VTRAEATANRAFAGATLLDLHQAVKARMESILSGFRMETKSGSSAPQTFDGWLPDKPSKKAVDESGAPAAVARDQFPFVLVRPINGRDSEQGADESDQVTVRIVLGTYGGDGPDGWFDLLILIEAIRQSLGASPVLATTSFEHVGPLEWEIPEEQAQNEWRGSVTTTWRVPRPWRSDSV